MPPSPSVSISARHRDNTLDLADAIDQFNPMHGWRLIYRPAEILAQVFHLRDECPELLMRGRIDHQRVTGADTTVSS
jgi:hypothetical protein